jgi:hypothetical protein
MQMVQIVGIAEQRKKIAQNIEDRNIFYEASTKQKNIT